MKAIVTNLLIFVSVAMGVGACKPKTSANSSQTKDLGAVKKGNASVAVYYANEKRTGWEKSAKAAIVSGAVVYTIDDAKGKPKTFATKTPAGKKVDLVEIAFQNPDHPSWYRGYVISDCFDWDKSKKISNDIKSSAKDIKGTRTMTLAPVGKQCGL